MPVLRQADNTLLIPSTRTQEWSTADPEYLIEKVRLHHDDWSFFRPMVRVLKNWRNGVTSDTPSSRWSSKSLPCNAFRVPAIAPKHCDGSFPPRRCR